MGVFPTLRPKTTRPNRPFRVSTVGWNKQRSTIGPTVGTSLALTKTQTSHYTSIILEWLVSQSQSFSDYAMVYSILYTTPILPTSWCFTTSSPVQIELLDDQGLGNWMVPWIGSLKFWKRRTAIFAEETGGYIHFSFLGAGRIWFFFLANDVLFDGWRTMLDTWYIETETVSRWRKTMAGWKIQHASRHSFQGKSLVGVPSPRFSTYRIACCFKTISLDL